MQFGIFAFEEMLKHCEQDEDGLFIAYAVHERRVLRKDGKLINHGDFVTHYASSIERAKANILDKVMSLTSCERCVIDSTYDNHTMPVITISNLECARTFRISIEKYASSAEAYNEALLDGGLLRW